MKQFSKITVNIFEIYYVYNINIKCTIEIGEHHPIRSLKLVMII